MMITQKWEDDDDFGVDVDGFDDDDADDNADEDDDDLSGPIISGHNCWATI